MSEDHPVLGIDYGDARIGVAATDALGLMAHPVETIATKQVDPLCRIKELIEQREVKQIVLGLPLKLDGAESASSIKVRKFAKELQKMLDYALPLHLVDERYTTVSAAQKLHAAGKNARKQKNLIDQAAAVEILSTWLGEQTQEFGDIH